ncbi:hypothetical protein PYCC9005_005894 [Savitreella phatthalungensis]
MLPLSGNLTTWVTTELWLTRTCLFLSFAIMAPTIILIILDCLLWVFRAGERRGRNVVRASQQSFTKRLSNASPATVPKQS